MRDGPDSLVLRLMRQVNAKLDRVTDNLSDTKVRVINVEENLAALNRRVDRLDRRIERIERRLNPGAVPATGKLTLRVGSAYRCVKRSAGRHRRAHP